MDLTSAQLQSDIVISHNAGEFFSDIEHLNYIIILHIDLPSFPDFSGVHTKTL
jgi:hypothetical protein